MANNGGHFGALTKAAVERWAKQFAPGVSIEQRPKGGYIVRDTYRPGAVYTGKTPRLAMREAGFIIIGMW